MNANSWEIMQDRFSVMSLVERISWLSQLIFILSMLARDTYKIGTAGVERPADLRRFNELIHRVATFQRKQGSDTDFPMVDSVFFTLLSDHLAVLNINKETILDLLNQ